MRKLSFILSLTIILASSFSCSRLAAAQDTSATSPLPEKEVQEFVTAIGTIKHYYIKDVPDQKLFNTAISGMLTSLDPHSSFLDADTLKELNSNIQGNFVGIGIELTLENGALKVISPLDDTPADKAGLKTNDLIIKVNNELIENMTLNEAINKIKGKKGTSVTLTILRPEAPKPIEVTIVRDTINVMAVKSKLLNQHYGYARITFFQGKADVELKQAINQLKKDSNNQLRGLVLDLRNNPGGLLNLSGNITDLFLDKNSTKKYNNLIVYTKGRIPNSDVSIKAKPNDIIPGIPLVVLINGGSASASEIVAGALQDYGRAVLMGSRTFGKGSVQTVIPIGNDSAIKLTTALYYTPAGRAIQAEGIIPDVTIPDFTIEKEDTAFKLTEADYRRHIVNTTDNSTDKKTNNIRLKEALSDQLQLAKDDYQLYSALLMLQGLHSAQ